MLADNDAETLFCLKNGGFRRYYFMSMSVVDIFAM